MRACLKSFLFTGLLTGFLALPPGVMAQPAITAQPQSRTVAFDGTATFSVAAAGADPLFYQWHVNCQNIRYATNSSLTVSNVDFSDLGSYSVTISNAYGQITSSDAVLGLSNLPPAIIRSQRTGTNLFLKWPRRDVAFQLQEIPAFTGTSLWKGADVAASGDSNGLTGGSDFAAAQRFFRLAAPTVTITSQPQGRSANPGDQVTLSVTATGVSPVRYFWSLNGTRLDGETNSTLTVGLDSLSKFGAYQALAYDANDGVLSRVAVIRQSGAEDVLSDSFQGRPYFMQNTGALHGTTFSATGESGEPLHANTSGGRSVWLNWHAPENGYVRFDTIGSGFDTMLAIYTGDSLSNLVEVASDDDSVGSLWSKIVFNVSAGQDFNIALDGYAGAAGFYNLNWQFTPSSAGLPVIDTQPQDVILNTNVVQATAFSVLAHSTMAGSNPTYQWFFNGSPVPASSGGTSNILRVGGPQPSVPLALGVYSVAVSDSGFVVRSREASLQFSSVPGLHFSAKPLISTLCGTPLTEATDCCGGKSLDAGNGKGNSAKALAAGSSGSLSGSLVYGGSSCGYSTNVYWTWITTNWSAKRTVTLTASVTGDSGRDSLVVLDAWTNLIRATNGAPPRTVKFCPTAGAYYSIGIGYNTPTATLSLSYTQSSSSCP
jgi:hypothetical protein